MRLYSETIAVFLEHATLIARDILTRECGLKVGRTRFAIGRTTYPLSLVCFEGDSRWGYFESQFYQIGLNARLAGQVSDAVLRDLLRHELAHYLTYIRHGNVSAHGPEFKATCESLGWPQEVTKASGDLPSLQKVGDLAADAVIEKVKKLLALASSSNAHEAELATLKANQLILRHHISRSHLQEGRELCVATLIEARKKSALMVTIYDILTHFLVKPVLFYGKGVVRLEAMGSRAQVELAQYIAQYLQQELERLWKLQQLKGLRAKNSFFVGIAKGYGEKLQEGRREFAPEETKALVRVESELAQDVRRYMGGLSSSHSGQILDGNAHASGVKEGHALNIRPAVAQGQGKVYHLGHGHS